MPQNSASRDDLSISPKDSRKRQRRASEAENELVRLVQQRHARQTQAVDAQHAALDGNLTAVAQARRHLKRHLGHPRAKDARRPLALLAKYSAWCADIKALALPLCPEFVALYLHDFARLDPQTADSDNLCDQENLLEHYNITPKQRKTLVKDFDHIRSLSASFFPNIPQAHSPLLHHPLLRHLCKPVPGFDEERIFRKAAKKARRSKKKASHEPSNQSQAHVQSQDSEPVEQDTSASVVVPHDLLPSAGSYQLDRNVTALQPLAFSTSEASNSSPEPPSSTARAPVESKRKQREASVPPPTPPSYHPIVVIDTDDEDQPSMTISQAPQISKPLAQEPPRQALPHPDAEVDELESGSEYEIEQALLTSAADSQPPEHPNHASPSSKAPPPSSPQPAPIAPQQPSPIDPSPKSNTTALPKSLEFSSALRGKKVCFSGTFQHALSHLLDSTRRAGATRGSYASPGSVDFYVKGEAASQSVSDLLARHSVTVLSEAEFLKLLPPSATPKSPTPLPPSQRSSHSHTPDSSLKSTLPQGVGHSSGDLERGLHASDRSAAVWLPPQASFSMPTASHRVHSPEQFQPVQPLLSVAGPPSLEPHTGRTQPPSTAQTTPSSFPTTNASNDDTNRLSSPRHSSPQSASDDETSLESSPTVQILHAPHTIYQAYENDLTALAQSLSKSAPLPPLRSFLNDAASTVPVKEAASETRSIASRPALFKSWPEVFPPLLNRFPILVVKPVVSHPFPRHPHRKPKPAIGICPLPRFAGASYRQQRIDNTVKRLRMSGPNSQGTKPCTCDWCFKRRQWFAAFLPRMLPHLGRRIAPPTHPIAQVAPDSGVAKTHPRPSGSTRAPPSSSIQQAAPPLQTSHSAAAWTNSGLGIPSTSRPHPLAMHAPAAAAPQGVLKANPPRASARPHVQTDLAQQIINQACQGPGSTTIARSTGMLRPAATTMPRTNGMTPATSIPWTTPLPRPTGVPPGNAKFTVLPTPRPHHTTTSHLSSSTAAEATSSAPSTSRQYLKRPADTTHAGPAPDLSRKRSRTEQASPPRWWHLPVSWPIDAPAITLPPEFSPADQLNAYAMLKDWFTYSCWQRARCKSISLTSS